MKNVNSFDFSQNVNVRFDEVDGLLSPPILRQEVKRRGNKKTFFYDVYHTIHSHIRASQRSIGHDIISAVLYYGTAFYLQGFTFYTIIKRDLPKHFAKIIGEKTKNIIVVTANDGSQVITCYKTKNAVKYLKNKTKTLW